MTLSLFILWDQYSALLTETLGRFTSPRLERTTMIRPWDWILRDMHSFTPSLHHSLPPSSLPLSLFLPLSPILCLVSSYAQVWLWCILFFTFHRYHVAQPTQYFNRQTPTLPPSLVTCTYTDSSCLCKWIQIRVTVYFLHKNTRSCASSHVLMFALAFSHPLYGCLRVHLPSSRLTDMTSFLSSQDLQQCHQE